LRRRKKHYIVYLKEEGDFLSKKYQIKDFKMNYAHENSLLREI